MHMSTFFGCSLAFHSNYNLSFSPFRSFDHHTDSDVESRHSLAARWALLRPLPQ